MKEIFERLVDHFVSGGFFLEEAVELLEKNLIVKALGRTGGNRSEASRVLGIHRNTLQRKLIEYGIDGAKVRRKPPQREKPRRTVPRAKAR